MNEHVSNALSGLFASTMSQLQPTIAGTHRRMRSLNRAAGYVSLWGLLSMALLCMGLMGMAPQASAQTAVFSGGGGSSVALGGGFNNLVGTAVDGHGNVYVADWGNHLVKEIPASCIAGANNASCVITLGGGFNGPEGVAVDGSGNVYVGDRDGHTVNEIPASCIAGANNASCTITLGGGFSGPSQVALDGSGNVYVADSFGTTVDEIPTSCITGANNASCTITLGGGFQNPYGVAVDGLGNVYVGDSWHSLAKEIPASCIAGANDASCTITIGGGWNATAGPYHMAVDGSGNVYTADLDNGAVKEIPASCITGANNASCVVTLGGTFVQPFGVSLSGTNLYVGDVGSNTVTEMSTLAPGVTNFGPQNLGTSSSVSTLTFTFLTGGTGVSARVVTQGVTGLDFIDAGTGTCTTNGSAHTYSAGDTCTIDVIFKPQAAGLRYGAATLANASGTVIATAYLNGLGEGALAVEFPGTQSNVLGSLPLPLVREASVVADAAGNLYAADTDNNRVVVAPVASLPGCAGGCTSISTNISTPQAVAVDGAGNLYIADTGNGDVIQELLRTNGTYVQGASVASGLTLPNPMAPVTVAVDGSGNVYIGDTTNQYVIKAPYSDLTCSTPGDCTTNIASGAGLDGPQGIALDGGGNIFIADTYNHRVLRVPSTDLTCSTPADCTLVADSIVPALTLPYGVSLDPAGNVYIADFSKAYAIKVLVSDLHCTSAINCTHLGTGLNSPSSVALDSVGDIFIADTGHNRAVEINVSGPATLTFPTTTTIPNVDSADGPKTATFTNIGNQSMLYTTPSSGANPSYASGFNYYVASSTCSDITSGTYSVAVNASCTYAAEFQPQGPGGGSYSGSIVVAANVNGTGQQTIANLSGTSNTTVNISLGSSPGGIGASLSGGGVRTIGDTLSLGASSPVDSGGVQYTFQSWSPVPPTTVPDQPASFTADYTATAWQLTVTTAGPGACTGSTAGPSGGYYASGAVVNISATPNASCIFSNWTGGTFGNANSSSTTVTTTGAPQTITAHFIQPTTYTMSITTNPGAIGLTVSTSGTKISGAFSTGPDTNSETDTGVISGTSYSFSTTSPQASGAYQYSFNNWTGSSTLTGLSQTVTASGPLSYTANFTLTAVQLTVNTNSPAFCSANIVTPATEWVAMPANTPIAISATPSAGCYFKSWSGSGIANPNAQSTTVNMGGAPETITADIEPIPYYVITVKTDDPQSTGSPSNGIASNCTPFIPPATPLPPTNPATPLDSNCSLRDAVTAAMANNGGAGYISWSHFAAPTFTQVLTGTTLLESALPNVSGLVSITGPGQNVIEVDGDNTYRVLTIDASAPNATNVAVTKLKLSDGNANNGGGIDVVAGTVTLDNLYFYHNAANISGLGGGAGGGLIVESDANVTLTNSAFSNNTAVGGGAILNAGTLSVANVSFSKDNAVQFTGGGVSASGWGGGIYQNGSPLSISDSTFNGETANVSGGAIYSLDDTTVNYSTFFQNAVTNGNGGAIASNGANIWVNNATLSNNSAPLGNGAGIYNDGYLILYNSIIAGGSSKGAAGVDLVDSAYTYAYDNDYYNNIDTLTDIEDDCYRCELNGGNYSAIVPGNPLVNANPHLELAPANNGSLLVPPTQTLLPLPSSAAICAADPIAIPLGFTLDQRGLPNTNSTYASSVCADLGAVQTNYSLALGVQPPPSVAPGTTMVPAPTVILSESGAPFGGASLPVSLTDLASDLTSTPATASTSIVPASAGVATFGSLIFTGPATADTLTASVALNTNPSSGLPLLHAGPSSTFNVTAIAPTVTMPVGTQVFGPKIGAAYLNSATAFGLVGGVNTNITADGTWTYTSSPNPTCYGAGPVYVPAPCASNVVTANSLFSVGTYTITATFTPNVAPYNTYFTAASSTASSNYTVTIETPLDPYTPAPASQTYSSPIALGSLNATFTGTVMGNPGTSLNGPFVGASCPVVSVNCSQYGTITYTATTAGGTVITNLTPGVGGTVLPVAAYTLTATFTPNATWAAQLTPVSGTAPYQVTQATPTFSPAWAPSVSTQAYGIPIPTGVLDATVTNATSGATTTTIPGTFHYTTTINGVPNLAITAGAGGTVLPVGSYTLGVTFIPQDSANFASASTTFSTYTVTQAVPVVSFAPVPATQVYGTNVLPGVLDATASYAISPLNPGNTLPVAGTFSYTAQVGAGPVISLSPQTAALPVGNYTITASFTPNDTTNYSSVTGTASYSVTALSPTLSLSPASQPYGPTIGVANSSYATSATATALVNGSSQTVPGTWSYAVSGCSISLPSLTAAQLAAEQLKACVYTVTGTFTPNGVSGALAATNFASSTVTSTYTVTQVTPSVVYTPAPSSTTYHQALVANSLTNAITATNPNLSSPGNAVAGTTAFSTTISSVPNQAVTVGQTSLPADTYLITATFTPTDTQDYAITTASAYYTVNQQTPLATVLPFAASPASQNYGSPIAAGTFALTAKDSVLASTPVAGSYSYTTPVNGVTTTLTQGIGGTVLPAGTYTVTASFTPSDTVDYAGLATPLPTTTYTVNAAPTTTTFTPPFSTMAFGTTIPSAFFDAAASYVVPPSGNNNAATPAGAFTYYLGTACSGTQISTATAPLAASATPYSITACFNPTDTSEFVTSFATSTLTVTPLAPTLSLTAAAQNYGPTVTTVNSTYTSATPGNNFASATAVINGTTTVIPGTWAISMTGCGTTIASVISTSVLPACTSYAVIATFTPTGASGNTAASNYIGGGTATSTYTVNVVTPTLSYSPSQVTQVFGTTVPAGVFDALATNANLSNPNTTPANPIPGNWSYTTSINNSSNASQIGTSTNNPSAGTSSSTVLPAGQYLIVATFTPTDTKDYASAAFITKAYTVTAAPPTDNFVPTPATQVYGTPITGVGAGTSLDANFFDPTTSANINTSGVISYTAQNGSGPVLTLIPNTTILQVGTYTLTASFAPNPGTSYLPATLTAAYSVTKNTPQLIFNPSPSSQSFGTPITAGSLNAVATANGTVVPGTVTYTATVGTTTVPAIAGVTILPAAAYTLTASFTPYDTTDYSSLTATASYTVNQAVPLITLTSSASPIFTNNAVTFTAIVSLNSVPGNVVAYLNGGTVNFLNGTTQIGTGTIINGVATFTTSSLPVAANSITAVYAGSANFTSATSAVLTETVTDFNFSLTLNSFTLQPNHEAVVNFTVSPLGSTTFPANIALSLNGLPAGATYSFTPATILAGLGAQQDVLTITVPPSTTVGKVEPAGGFSGKLPALALALLLLPFAGRLRKNSKRLSRLLSILLLVAAGLTASIGLSGCGANIGGFFGQQPATYNVVITGTSGTLSHSTTITLTVE